MEWSNADRFQDRDDDAREIPQEFLGHDCLTHTKPRGRAKSAYPREAALLLQDYGASMDFAASEGRLTCTIYRSPG
jgi:hypothetical protein